MFSPYVDAGGGALKELADDELILSDWVITSGAQAIPVQIVCLCPNSIGYISNSSNVFCNDIF